MADLTAVATSDLIQWRVELAKYSEDQPRVPAGGPDGGEFAGGSSAGGGLPSMDRGFAARLDEHSAPAISELARQHGMTVPEYKEAVNAKLAGLMARAEVHIRVPASVLPSILSDGRLKSQFETAKSTGALNTDTRAAVEQTLFGYPKDLAPEGRPIYGYFADPNREVRNTLSYGDAVIVLKPSVADNATVQFGDSLAGEQLTQAGVSPARSPTIDAYDMEDAAQGVFSTDPLALTNLEDHTGWPYAEAQIHGGVKLGDIAEIRFQDSSPSKSVASALRAQGIPWSRGTLTGRYVWTPTT